MSASRLLDALRDRFSLKNDSTLSRALEVDPSIISKARQSGRVSSILTLRIHETFDLPIKEIRALGEQQ